MKLIRCRPNAIQFISLFDWYDTANKVAQGSYQVEPLSLSSAAGPEMLLRVAFQLSRSQVGGASDS